MNLELRMSQVYIENDVHHFEILIRKSMLGFTNRVSQSDNGLIFTIVNSNYYFYSCMFKHWSKYLF